MKAKRPPSRALRFLRSALTFSALFLVTHLLGFRQYVSVLSGTASFGSLERVAGLAYLTLYGSFVVCVPVLVIASGLAKVVELLGLEGRSGTGHGGDQPGSDAGPQPSESAA